MSDEKKSNLEPIEDNDLAKKFGHVEKGDFGAKKEDEKEAISFDEKKEPAKEIVGAEKDDSYNKILSKIKSKKSDDDKANVKKDAENVSQKTDAESQVQHLVDIAINKDVVHAVKVAKHVEDNYVLDMFHDRLLSDELHDALVAKGLIK